jgi:hypothetical protein
VGETFRERTVHVSLGKIATVVLVLSVLAAAHYLPVAEFRPVCKGIHDFDEFLRVIERGRFYGDLTDEFQKRIHVKLEEAGFRTAIGTDGKLLVPLDSWLYKETIWKLSKAVARDLLIEKYYPHFMPNVFHIDPADRPYDCGSMEKVAVKPRHGTD